MAPRTSTKMPTYSYEHSRLVWTGMDTSDWNARYGWVARKAKATIGSSYELIYNNHLDSSYNREPDGVTARLEFVV